MAENRGTRANRLLSWSLQQIQHNSHQTATSATQHMNELHNYVLQGLGPLIVPTSSNQQSTSPSEMNSSNAHPRSNVDGESSSHRGLPVDFVIDFDSAAVDDPNGNSQHGPQPNSNSTNANNNDSEFEQAASNLRNLPEWQALISIAEKYVPFILILLLKLIFDHRIGILVNLGLFIAFCHANGIVKREVAKQGKRRLRSLFLSFVNLNTAIFGVYLVLADAHLANALVFLPPYSAPIEFWDVLWIVSVTDLALRIITVIVKIVIVALPAKIIAYQKRGKLYLFCERFSQLYRTVIPMQHWLYFFSESYSGPSKVFGVILSAAYLIFKTRSIFSKLKLWRISLIKILSSKTYGVTPSNNQIKEAGDACPICQDDYKSPSMLQCKHIFCEECVALWFDRERTCPICRAQIADDPTWRDGSTTYLHQLF